MKKDALAGSFELVDLSSNKKVSASFRELNKTYRDFVIEASIGAAALFANYFRAHPNAELFIYARQDYDDEGWSGNNIWRVDSQYVREKGAEFVTSERMGEIKEAEGWMPEALYLNAQSKMKKHRGVRERDASWWTRHRTTGKERETTFKESKIAKVLPDLHAFPLLRIHDFDAAISSPILQNFWAELAEGKEKSTSHGVVLMKETFESEVLPWLGIGKNEINARIERDQLKQGVTTSASTTKRSHAL
jgi:hypothetical protein